MHMEPESVEAPHWLVKPARKVALSPLRAYAVTGWLRSPSCSLPYEVPLDTDALVKVEGAVLQKTVLNEATSLY